jgi:hypothetical protein
VIELASVACTLPVVEVYQKVGLFAEEDEPPLPE